LNHIAARAVGARFNFADLTTDKKDLIKKIKAVDMNGGSFIWDSLKYTYDNILKKESSGRRSAVVFMTDGEDGSRDTTFTDLMETVELGYLLDCADALVAGALVRTESRGAHFREDHPLRDDANWLKHTLATREQDGSIRIEYKPVKMGPYVPMERKY